MRRRSKIGREPIKSRRKTAARKRGNAPNIRRSLSAGGESETARLASELSAMSEILRLIAKSPSNGYSRSAISS